MCKTCLTVNAARRYDPTMTTTLRQQFEADMARRFRRVARAIRKAVGEEDGFGLKANRGQFDFARSDQKVEAFMDWLYREMNDEVLDVKLRGTRRMGQSAWSNVYIRSAYQKGLARAASRMRQQGADVAPEWVTEAFTRPFHVDRVALAYTRTFRELEGITDAMDQQISRVLAEGLSEGRGPMDIARGMVDRVEKVGITRARMLARTEVIRSHADASLNTYEEAEAVGVQVEAEFSTAQDDQVCEECRALEGRTYALSEARGLIPVHPNCLPGDSLVLARDGVTAASKRWFDGDMIIIRTASGRELTCTPNHPVLTSAGWVPAKMVNQIGHVISDGGREWEALGNDNGQQVVSRIEDVAESVRGSRHVASREMPLSAPDFHGDALDGDVAVVWTNRLLANAEKTTFRQHLDELAFVLGGMRDEALSGLGALHHFIKGNLAPLGGCVRCGDLSAALASGHGGPLEGFSLGLTSERHARGSQSPLNGASIHARSVGYGFEAFASRISGFNTTQLGVDHFGSGHLVRAENAPDDFVSDAVLARQLANGDAGPVFADNVVSFDVQSFSGHVYNLETPTHHYVAQGVVTHNCRCAFIPVLEKPKNVRLR